MDTTPEYIKMCEKAEEIQSLKLKPIYMMQSETNLLYEDNDIWYIFVLDKSKKSWLIKKIWLPRQDQLQEMVIGIDNEYHLLTSFYNFCSHFTHRSFEKLWFSFVMKEKYNKVWTGEEWK